MNDRTSHENSSYKNFLINMISLNNVIFAGLLILLQGEISISERLNDIQTHKKPIEIEINLNFKFNKQHNVTTDVKHEPLDDEKLDVKNNTTDAITKSKQRSKALIMRK